MLCRRGGHYSRARQVALLAGLPVHRLLLSQLSQEASSQKAKRQWSRLEGRVSFWRRCHRRLQEDGTDPESAAGFFLSRSEPGTGEPAQTEVLDVQERMLLLLLGARWLSLLSPAPLDRLESLEKRFWSCRVQRHVLGAAAQRQSVFSAPAASPDSYQELLREFSFSSIPQLNGDACLRPDGVPGPSEDPGTDAGLGPEGRSVLSSLVGRLLDEGSVQEAARVCRYFSLRHGDMWTVLRCHGLASGTWSPDTEDGDAAGETLTSSPSSSSLSSFAMCPLPEDAVSVQLQKMVSQCCHGNSYCKQVLSLYQLSKELRCPFLHLCRDDPPSVLQKLLLSDQPDRFRRARAFIGAQGLSPDSVAQLVSSAVVRGLLASGPEPQPANGLAFRPGEGRGPLLQLLRLCDDPSLVGLRLMEDLSRVPLRDPACVVELLVVAHLCFSLTCHMEGIVRVLQAARHLSHAHLAPGGHHSLLVRLLTGIGRYKEMTYVLDLLHQNHSFEMLLRKKVDADGQGSGLKTALLDYIKRCLPADSEKHNMVALCFSMRREIGENHEMAARTQLKMIESRAWAVTPELRAALVKVLALLKDAAESFSKDSCERQAGRCVRTAKLVALQLHLLNQDSDLRVINLRPAELLDAIVALPRCYQVLVVCEAYGSSPDWAEILYRRTVLQGDFVFLEELKRHRPLTCSLFEDVFRKLDGVSGGVAANVKRLLSHCEDVYGRYKLAYQQNLYDVTKTLLQDPQTANYLNDRLSS